MTPSQRARLVVALGVLNLVLATLAFAVGIGAPRQPLGGIAAAPTAAPSIAQASPPVASNPPSRSPAPTEPTPSPEVPPSVAPPSVQPTPSEVPIGGAEVAERPPARPPATNGPEATSAPTASPTHPSPTPASTPAPTTKPPPTPKPEPTPKPPPTPQPASKPVHPPCPGTVDGPPGHNKGQPYEKPCGKSGGNGHDNGGNGSKGGVVVVLPIGLAALVAGGRRRVSRSLRRRPLAR